MSTIYCIVPVLQSLNAAVDYAAPGGPNSEGEEDGERANPQESVPVQGASAEVPGTQQTHVLTSTPAQPTNTVPPSLLDDPTSTATPATSGPHGVEPLAEESTGVGGDATPREGLAPEGIAEGPPPIPTTFPVFDLDKFLAFGVTPADDESSKVWWTIETYDACREVSVELPAFGFA